MINWMSYVSYDYDTETNCEGEGCDDICRCSRIVNPRITETSLYDWELAGRILGDAADEFQIYIMNRLLAHSKFTSDSWDIRTSHGYYGEEIDGIEPDKDVMAQIEMWRSQIFEYDKNDLLKLAINKEYGLVQNKFSNMKFNRIEKLKLADVIYPRHWKQNRDRVDGYKNVMGENLSEWIIGLVYEKNGTFNLIDGQHRLVAATELVNSMERKPRLKFVIVDI